MNWEVVDIRLPFSRLPDIVMKLRNLQNVYIEM